MISPASHLSPVALAAGPAPPRREGDRRVQRTSACSPRAGSPRAGDSVVPAATTSSTGSARVGTELEHWIDRRGAACTVSSTASRAELDAQALILELQPLLGIPDQLLADLPGGDRLDARRRRVQGRTAAGRPPTSSLRADFQTIEAAMTEGHPGFVANNGRIGFGVSEHAAYAPESGRPFRLVWLAARRSLSPPRARRRPRRGIPPLAASSSPAERARVRGARSTRLGEDPAGYHLLPVHPWRSGSRGWPITFAADLGRRDLVYVGESTDHFPAAAVDPHVLQPHSS